MGRRVWRGALGDPLLRNAYALTASSVLTSGLGFLYWIAAARLYDVEEVGRNAVLISAVLILSSFAQLNLGAALPRLLPAAGLRTSRLVALSYLSSSVLALALGGAFVLLALRLDAVELSASMAIPFCISVVLWGVFTLQDAILAGLRQAIWVPVENVVFGVLKIVALILLVSVGGGYGVFLSWTLPVLAIVLPLNIFVFRRAIPAHVARHGAAARPFGASALRKFVAFDYLASLFTNAIPFLLPWLVVVELGDASNGRFYSAWVISVAAKAVVGGLIVSLSVEGALDEDALPSLTRRVVRKATIIGLPLLAGILLFADPILRVYGSDYVDAANALRLLGLGAAARAVIDTFHVIARVRRRAHVIFISDAIACTVTVALAIPMTDVWGITGTGWAYLIGQGCVALAVAPRILAEMRSPDRTLRDLARVPVGLTGSN